MRWLLLTLLVGIGAVGCTHFEDPYDGRLTDVPAQLVADCELVGVITENADASEAIPLLATRKMIKRVNARAVQLRATHLVWLHKTKLAATVEAYRCKSP